MDSVRLNRLVHPFVRWCEEHAKQEAIRKTQNMEEECVEVSDGEIDSEIHSKQSKINPFASTKTKWTIGHWSLHARTHHSPIRALSREREKVHGRYTHTHTRRMHVKTQNSIAQSMSDETLTIEHDIDMFKLIFSFSLTHTFALSTARFFSHRIFFSLFPFAALQAPFKAIHYY